MDNSGADAVVRSFKHCHEGTRYSSFEELLQVSCMGNIRHGHESLYCIRIPVTMY